jgi:hypothetical protein
MKRTTARVTQSFARNLDARRGADLYLLAIKHHRQLSFDFPELLDG